MTMTGDQKKRMLNAARHAVADACRVTRKVQRALTVSGQITKDDRSPVTVADFAAQAIVAHRLATDLGHATDTLNIIGEENAGMLRDAAHGEVLRQVVEAVSEVWLNATPEEVLDAIDACDHDASARGYWTLDPVDGTKGFMRGEQYAISLAWIEGGRVELGVLGCPNLSSDFERRFDNPDSHGLIFYATRGDGAFAAPADLSVPEGRPVRIRPHDPAGLVRVCESVESGHTKQDETALIVEHLGGAGKPARLDSQCKYAVVARGQADAYLRLPTKPGYVEKIWDHAAGMIVAAEAGAIVTDVEGKPLDFSRGSGLSGNRGVICAAPAFHGRIMEAIRSLGLAGVGA